MCIYIYIYSSLLKEVATQAAAGGPASRGRRVPGPACAASTHYIVPTLYVPTLYLDT